METKTQRDKILGVLVSARGGWVPLPEITALAAQYNARLHELRRLGFHIENRIRDMDGTRHSWFRLAKASKARGSLELLPVPQRPIQQGLFPERHQDE